MASIATRIAYGDALKELLQEDEISLYLMLT